MENNEENLGSQEPTQETTSQENTSTTNPGKNLNIKAIAIGVVIVAVALFLFFTIFTRGAKDTVKDFIKAIDKGDEKKIGKLIDMEGNSILLKVSKSNGEYDFEKFEEYYDELKDAKKDLEKDEKKEYDDSMEESTEKVASNIVKTFDSDYKYKVKEIKTKSVKDAKGVTKVTVKVQVENDDGDKETSTLTFYTLRKGLKDYIISTNSIFGLVNSNNANSIYSSLNSLLNY